MPFRSFSFLALLLLGSTVYAQSSGVLLGIVTDEKGLAVPNATIRAVGKSELGTVSNTKGSYRLTLPVGTWRVEVSSIGFGTVTQSVEISANTQRTINVKLSTTTIQGAETVIKAKANDGETTKQTVDIKALQTLPTVSGNLENTLPLFALGARFGTGGELSSQYSVRGGSYDENLVYVNGFEVYRPMLIRTGQQEGLTFANLDLIRNLAFASGGFEPLYGDKMSSVLDVEYKQPTDFHGSVAGSLLGGSAHVEGSVRKPSDTTGQQRFRYLVGARYKTTNYLLGSLDTKGEYQPSFTDLQANLSYDINRYTKLEYLGNYNNSYYRFVPASRSTTLGLVNLALQLDVFYEGQEITEFGTYMNGLSLTTTRKNYYLKWLASAYHSDESEKFDVVGYYSLGLLETDLSKSNAGKVVSLIGDGIEHQFGRNTLTADVQNFEHKGGANFKMSNRESHNLQWGAKIQHELISDKLHEWTRLDSAGYSLRWDTNSVNLHSVYNAQTTLNSMRYSAYVQDSWAVRTDGAEWKVIGGVRGSWWDVNKELIVTPRVQATYHPLRGKDAKSDLTFRLATGLYYQPPFYREMRDFSGNVNTALRSQKSAHVVAGVVYDFKMYGRKFKFISEAYYKRLWDLDPYDQDNVKIRYYALNNAQGYATGLDLRLNGELVEGAESWVNLSFLRTRESIDGVQHKETVAAYKTSNGIPTVTDVPDVPRPTDQLVSLTVLFQDYLPKNKNFKMHLNGVLATGLPFGYPGNNIVFRNTYRYDGYQRFDLGFSALLWKRGRPTRFPALTHLNTAWLSLEVFNLTDVRNEASVSWVRTIFDQQFAVPNNLTSRRLNLRLKIDF